MKLIGPNESYSHILNLRYFLRSLNIGKKIYQNQDRIICSRFTDMPSFYEAFGLYSEPCQEKFTEWLEIARNPIKKKAKKKKK